jgi:hypothetical protein
MGLKIKLISLFIGMIFVLFVLRFSRKNSIRPSYAFLWIMVSLFLISIPVFEPVYKYIATSIVGISDARHIIYIGLIGFLLVFVFYLTAKISRMNDQIQVLISFTAILEKDIKEKAKTCEPTNEK